MTKQATTTDKPKQVIRRVFEGEVVSVVEDKTIHVRVARTVMNKKYRKQYTVHKKFAVHDEKNEAKLGDTVSFKECRPMSKTKRWRLISIVKTAA